MWSRLAAGVGILALAAFFGWLYGRSQYHAGQLDERDKWRVEQLVAQSAADQRRVEQERQNGLAYAALAERIAAREPIILRSTNTVKEYAQTPAGAARCLGAERVLGIDAFDRELFDLAAPATAEGDGAVRADTGAPSGGR